MSNDNFLEYVRSGFMFRQFQDQFVQTGAAHVIWLSFENKSDLKLNN